jgi:hypothetical protein
MSQVYFQNNLVPFSDVSLSYSSDLLSPYSMVVTDTQANGNIPLTSCPQNPLTINPPTIAD